LLLAVWVSWLSTGRAFPAETPDCGGTAGDTASILKVEAEAVEQHRREFRDCLFFPELYDTRRDRCTTMHLDYRYAKRRHAAARGAFEREIKEGDRLCLPIP
jgi:hypothetical protein